MAQLVLTIAGGVAGNALGGGLGQSLGALLGAVAGGFIDKELFGPQSERRKTETGKLSDIRLSGSAYGQTIARVYGRGRVPANIIWARGIREEVRTETQPVGGTGGGKGGLGKKEQKTGKEACHGCAGDR